MTHYNNLSVKLSDSQLDKLKSAKKKERKNENGAILRLSSNRIGNSNNAVNFSHI